MRILNFHVIDLPFSNRVPQPIGTWIWLLPMATMFQGREPQNHFSFLLQAPCVSLNKGWLRMGGNDNIDLIIQGLLISASGEGREKGCLS